MSQRYQPELKRLSEPSEWLTLGQAAKYLGVAQSTIRKWCDAGRVPAFTTPGGHRRFRRSDLDDFIERSRPNVRTRSGPSILVVDNEPGIRAYVRASLEPEGYAVDEATDAEEGLRMIEMRAPDLIMIASAMPQPDGWEMLRRLRERYGDKTPPVVLFSADDEGDEQLALARGASAIFGRPLDPHLLTENARRALPL
ncbi:MAG: response regulator [Gaiellaceae bacterium]|jgi:excisionase family DNA binding protein